MIKGTFFRRRAARRQGKVREFFRWLTVGSSGVALGVPPEGEQEFADREIVAARLMLAAASVA